jgi:hypothetical protein
MTEHEFWEREFGKTQSAKDFAGRTIKRGDYGKEQ